MNQIIRIGMDTSKQVFQLHGVDAGERVVLRRRLRRRELEAFFARLPPCRIGIEACGSSHHWARVLGALGHEVAILPPQYVKPYVKRGKNDAADAEALCEAMSRPTMRFVPAKTADQQAALMLAGVRETLVRQRTRLGNAIRGHAAEFGVVAAKGRANIKMLLERIAADDGVPALAREMFAELGAAYAHLQSRLAELDERLLAVWRSNALAQRLATIPGIGPLTATLLAIKLPDPSQFRSARAFAAWLGLTPKDHSTAGRQRLGVITRAGDETLRSLLVVGATAVVWQARRRKSAAPWLAGIIARKEPKLAAVALANRNARIAWALMVRGGVYRQAAA